MERGRRSGSYEWRHEAPPAPRERPRKAPDLTGDERASLHDLARVAVGVAAGTSSDLDLDAALRAMPAIRVTGGVFVTLTERGELRGCVGTVDPDLSLPAAVVRAATWAACGDLRFEPVRRGEVVGLDVEVSVLGPMVPLRDPLAFELGVDGILVSRDRRRGILLPEVATSHHLDRIAMLETACRKAGMPARAWRDDEAQVHAFRTTRFGAPRREARRDVAAASRASG